MTTLEVLRKPRFRPYMVHEGLWRVWDNVAGEPEFDDRRRKPAAFTEESAKEFCRIFNAVEEESKAGAP